MQPSSQSVPLHQLLCLWFHRHYHSLALPCPPDHRPSFSLILLCHPCRTHVQQSFQVLKQPEIPLPCRLPPPSLHPLLALLHSPSSLRRKCHRNVALCFIQAVTRCRRRNLVQALTQPLQRRRKKKKKPTQMEPQLPFNLSLQSSPFLSSPNSTCVPGALVRPPPVPPHEYAFEPRAEALDLLDQRVVGSVVTTQPPQPHINPDGALQVCSLSRCLCMEAFMSSFTGCREALSHKPRSRAAPRHC